MANEQLETELQHLKQYVLDLRRTARSSGCDLNDDTVLTLYPELHKLINTTTLPSKFSSQQLETDSSRSSEGVNNGIEEGLTRGRRSDTEERESSPNNDDNNNSTTADRLSSSTAAGGGGVDRTVGRRAEVGREGSGGKLGRLRVGEGVLVTPESITTLHQQHQRDDALP